VKDTESSLDKPTSVLAQLGEKLPMNPSRTFSR
jgi:hypothetical protein